MIDPQVPACAIFLDGQPVCRREMAAERLPTPTTIQADDVITLNGSPNGNRRGSLGDGFCRFAEADKRRMDGRDQGGELIRLDLIASNIGGDDFDSEFGRPLIGHRQILPLFGQHYTQSRQLWTGK